MAEPTRLPFSAGRYRSYVLRLWQSHDNGLWHASLQSIQSGMTLHFTDLAALFVFLQQREDDCPASSTNPMDEDLPDSPHPKPLRPLS